MLKCTAKINSISSLSPSSALKIVSGHCTLRVSYCLLNDASIKTARHSQVETVKLWEIECWFEVRVELVIFRGFTFRHQEGLRKREEVVGLSGFGLSLAAQIAAAPSDKRPWLPGSLCFKRRQKARLCAESDMLRAWVVLLFITIVSLGQFRSYGMWKKIIKKRLFLALERESFH